MKQMQKNTEMFNGSYLNHLPHGTMSPTDDNYQ